MNKVTPLPNLQQCSLFLKTLFFFNFSKQSHSSGREKRFNFSTSPSLPSFFLLLPCIFFFFGCFFRLKMEKWRCDYFRCPQSATHYTRRFVSYRPINYQRAYCDQRRMTYTRWSKGVRDLHSLPLKRAFSLPRVVV